MPAKFPSDEEQSAATLPSKGLNGRPPSRLTRLTQSMAFLSSGGIEALYSGLAMRNPSCAAIWRASFCAFSGTPFSLLEILIHQRQRIVAERDARHVGALQRQFLHRRVGSP